MAHGTGTSSWRTRHLHVRSSFLKEALDVTAPGGLWKLLHLRGTELVADGLTKPLQGQSFARFVQDLGMNREEQREANAETQANGQGQAAIRALVAGSLLMSQASGSVLEESENEGMDWVFTAGAILMTLDAVYAGQLVVESSRCRSRRMRCALEVDVLRDLQGLQSRGRRDQDIVVVSER